MSYGLKYIVPFKTLSEISCEIRMEIKDYSGSVMDLTGGANPFRIETDTTDLLTPIRASGATLSVFGSDYLQDLYASDPQGVKVTVMVGGNIHWMGFLTPDTFSQDFSRPDFTYEMECVCALSTLKYREFDLTDDFVTFAQIVSKAIEYAWYSDVIYTNSVRLHSGSYFSAKVASANFYDELGEPMKYYEVLEEISKWVGCTWEPYEDILYFKDSAAIRSGYVSYTKLSGGTVNLQDLKTVTSYKGTGTKLSRIAGKNKAIVNCSLYETKDLLPEFNDEKSEFVRMRDDFTEIVKEGKENVTYRGIIRYFKQPKYTFYKYAYANPAGINEFDGPLTDMDGGSAFVKMAEYKENDIPSKLSFSDELQVRMYLNDSAAQNGTHLNKSCPILKMVSDRDVFIHPNVWLCIGIQSKIMVEEWSKVANAGMLFPGILNLRQRAKFKIGDYYYNGTGWVKTETTFEMPYDWKMSDTGDNFYGSWKGLKNTNTFDKGIGDIQGYTFKAPPSPVLGKVELTLYAIIDVPYRTELGTVLRCKYVYYKDIYLNYGIPNEQSIYGDWVDKDSKNDIIYENVIEGDYVEEADEIDLKICTNTDGKLALSSVMEGNNFLQEIVTDVYGTGQAENILIQRVIDLYETPRFVIDPTLANDAKPWTKFTEPHLNKQFLVAGGEEDVKMERTRYNLIEL